MSVYLRASAFSGVVLLLFSGCGGDRVYPSGSVTGNVTLDGKPLSSGQAVFVSDDPKATGKELFAMPVTEGLLFVGAIPAGKYSVYLMPTGGSPGPKGPVASVASGSPSTPGGAGGGGNIPKKYQSPSSSGWTLEVKEKVDNKLTLEMTK